MSLTFKWTVTTNYVNGDPVYQVYRNRFTDQPDHSGNREFRGGVFDVKAEAQAYADKLNGAEISAKNAGEV